MPEPIAIALLANLIWAIVFICLCRADLRRHRRYARADMIRMHAERDAARRDCRNMKGEKP